MIIWGQGVILGNAEEEFKAFVETSGIPAAMDHSWTFCFANSTSTQCRNGWNAWELWAKYAHQRM